jgi:molybdate/tungstate transport system substrate-binding protein
MIIDGLRAPDIFVSAGTVPMKRLMNNTTPSADWLVKFGSAERVIAYSPTSRFFKDLEKARIGETPWYQVLANQELKFGRTDPELDPRGFYMFIAAELANLYYNDSGIKQIKPIAEGDLESIPSSIRGIVEEENSATFLSQEYNHNLTRE